MKPDGNILTAQLDIQKSHFFFLSLDSSFLWSASVIRGWFFGGSCASIHWYYISSVLRWFSTFYHLSRDTAYNQQILKSL